MSSRASRTLYVGNLPGDIREREVEDLFYKVISSVCDWIGCMHVHIYTCVMLMSKIRIVSYLGATTICAN